MSVEHNGRTANNCVVVFETSESGRLAGARGAVAAAIEAMHADGRRASGQYNIISNYLAPAVGNELWVAVHVHPFGPTVASVAWTGLVVSDESACGGAPAEVSAGALARGLARAPPAWAGSIGVSAVSPELMADIWKQMISDAAGGRFANPRQGFMDAPMLSNTIEFKWEEGPERSLEFSWPNYP